MDKRVVGVLIFAVVVAFATSYGVYRLVGGRLAAERAAAAEVHVAARDLPVGTLLTEADLRAEDWAAPLPKTAVTDKRLLLERAVVQTVSEGEVFTEGRLAPKGGGAGLAATIPKGMRAIAVKVNEVVGLAGFVLPGMKVDVIALGDKPGTASNDPVGTQSKTILQNIEVLSAGQNIERNPDGRPITVQVVNLLVTPEQAELISLAGVDAKIQLVLRNPLDTAEVKTEGTTTGQLFGGPAPRIRIAAAGPAAPRAAPPPPKMEKVTVPITMEIIGGGKRNAVKVGETEEDRPVEAGRKR